MSSFSAAAWKRNGKVIRASPFGPSLSRVLVIQVGDVCAVVAMTGLGQARSAVVDFTLQGLARVLLHKLRRFYKPQKRKARRSPADSFSIAPDLAVDPPIDAKKIEVKDDRKIKKDNRQQQTPQQSSSWGFNAFWDDKKQALLNNSWTSKIVGTAQTCLAEGSGPRRLAAEVGEFASKAAQKVGWSCGGVTPTEGFLVDRNGLAQEDQLDFDNPFNTSVMDRTETLRLFEGKPFIHQSLN